jgi:hypothetical protein
MISILTPSRSRPALAQRMVNSAMKNPGCEVEIKFFLNDDDPLLEEYKAFLTPDQYTVGPNQSTSYSWNLMAAEAKHDILFLVGDDAQFGCERWGVKILEAFDQYPDKIACIYPRAPSVSKKKNPHFCIHKNWVNAVGYYLPPHFYHWYVDTWIRDVALHLNRFHLIPDFEMPVENIKDQTSSSYHTSWMRQKDDWMWKVTQRHLMSDVDTLRKFIRDFR